MADTFQKTTDEIVPRVGAIVEELRPVAIRALGRMYLPERGVFAFRLRRTPDGGRLEGVSHRYTAIALIGLATEPPEVAREVLHGDRPEAVCARLVEAAQSSEDVGEVALAHWCGRVLDHPEAPRALARLRSMDVGERACPTVELAWCLTSLVVPAPGATDQPLAQSVAERLLASFNPESKLFPHWPLDAASGMRSHVACYADLVYPIQALCYYHRATGSAEALTFARECASRMVSRQGPDGQWWWHYDVRTGRVLERYPVYAVHQDAMGPMALHALEDAGGERYAAAVARSLEWLLHAPEIDGSLFDRRADVIWRKVARREPNKLTRRMQAVASRVHPSLRVPGVGLLFPPVSIDDESRPYHMGWILHAFPRGRYPTVTA